MIVVKVQRKTLSGIATDYYADGELLLYEDDVPPNVRIRGRLHGKPQLRRSLSGPMAVGSGSQAVTGDITLGNTDGALDVWMYNDATGLPMSIYNIPEPIPMPLNLEDYLILTCYAGRANVSESQVQVPFRDRSSDLEKALLPDPNKPRVMGDVYGLSPVMVNAAMSIYRVSDKPAFVRAAYDRGAVLGPSWMSGPPPHEWTEAQINDSGLTVPAGEYRFCVQAADGSCLVRLGSKAEQLTVDACEYGGRDGTTPISAGKNTILGMVQTLLSWASPSTTLVHDGHTLLTTVNSGLVVSSSTTAAQVLQQIMSGVDGWYATDKQGRLSIGVFGVAASPVIEINEVDFRERMTTANNNDGKGVSTITVKFKRNQTVLSSIAAAAPDLSREIMGKEWQTVATTPPAEIDPSWRTVEMETVMNSVPTVLLDGLVDKYTGWGSTTLQLVLPLQKHASLPYDVGSTVSVVSRRMGHAGGVNYVVTSMQLDFETDKLTLTLWR